MSYDIRVWTVENPRLRETLIAAGFESQDDFYVLPLKQGRITISNQTSVAFGDIPDEISRELPGIRYLVEGSLEPFTSEEHSVARLVGAARLIGREWRGVVENPQTGEIIMPSGVKRLAEYEKQERFTLLTLSWWFNDEEILKVDRLRQFIDLIERSILEALPRRYGLYEPPQEKYQGKEPFIRYLSENARKSIIWYPTKPVDYVSFSVPQRIGPSPMGYRFGHLSVSVDDAVVDMPGWSRALNQFFKGVSQIVNPIYGDMYFLKNHLRSKTVSRLDKASEEHPTSAWWWNGIPRKLGVGLVVGEPLKDKIRFKREFTTLGNGSALVLPEENDMHREVTSRDVAVDEELLQPRETVIFGIGKKRYPRTWPFAGPFSD